MSPIKDFAKCIQNEIDFTRYNTVFCGFSGGADSTALLLILDELSKTVGFQLIAVHFEHGIRECEGKADAEWCKQFCAARQLRYLEFSLDTHDRIERGESIESGARRLRLEKWKELSSSHEKPAIALAHHADDKIENLVLRLCRGSNVSGLTSLRTAGHVEGICFLRPLLNHTRSRIETLLRTSGVTDWRTDSTNSENRYKRNYIRNSVLPGIYSNIPASRHGIVNAYHTLQADAEYIESEALKQYRSLDNGPGMSAEFLAALHPALRIRVLRFFLNDELGHDFIPNRDLIERLDAELPRKSGEKILIPLVRSLFLCLHNGRLSVCNREAQTVISSEVKWDWKKNPELHWSGYILKAEIVTKEGSMKVTDGSFAYFGPAFLPETLIVRQWQDGDRIIPFGSAESVRVKKIFQNEKVPEGNRRSIPILCSSSGEVIWICGVKRSAFAAVPQDASEMVAIRALQPR